MPRNPSRKAESPRQPTRLESIKSAIRRKKKLPGSTITLAKGRRQGFLSPENRKVGAAQEVARDLKTVADKDTLSKKDLSNARRLFKKVPTVKDRLRTVPSATQIKFHRTGTLASGRPAGTIQRGRKFAMGGRISARAVKDQFNLVPGFVKRIMAAASRAGLSPAKLGALRKAASKALGGKALGILGPALEVPKIKATEKKARMRKEGA